MGDDGEGEYIARSASIDPPHPVEAGHAPPANTHFRGVREAAPYETVTDSAPVGVGVLDDPWIRSHGRPKVAPTFGSGDLRVPM